jgi:hypothetical protein
MMKATLNKLRAKESENAPVMQEGTSAHPGAADDGMDVSLLDDSLAKTPWERMQANDDALRFADSLRTAMEKRKCKTSAN